MLIILLTIYFRYCYKYVINPLGNIAKLDYSPGDKTKHVRSYNLPVIYSFVLSRSTQVNNNSARFG